MTSTRITPFLILCLALALHAPRVAADERPSVRDQVAAELEAYRQGLDLSDYTWARVELILKSGIREQVGIAQRHGLTPGSAGYSSLDSKQQRSLERALKDSRKTTAERMERFLDKQQLKQFKAFQKSRADSWRAQGLASADSADH